MTVYQPTVVAPVPDLPRAACRGMDTALFVANDGDAGGAAARGRVAEAKRVCWRCPERKPCLEFALDNPVLKGVWGGTTAKDRKAMRGDRDGA